MSRLRSKSLRVAAMVALLASCSVYSRQAGVANLWREEGNIDGFEIGRTEMADILDRLGPPSQLIELGERVVLYYLLERTEGSSLFLVVYNSSTERVQYDRAVFVCDAGGVLRQMSLSREALPGG